MNRDEKENKIIEQIEMYKLDYLEVTEISKDGWEIQGTVQE